MARSYNCPNLETKQESHRSKSYRPIALSKTLLSWHLEFKNLILNEQCGFRRGRSTTDQLVTLHSEVKNAFKNKQHVVTAYFDIEKKMKIINK